MFSGTGVARLREFLNEQKAHAAATGSVTPSVADDSDLIDIDIDNPDSDGSNTPIVNVDVHHNYSVGSTPVVSGPPGHMVSFHHMASNHQHHGHGTGGGPSILSQSAPATTSVAAWSGGHTSVAAHQGGSAQHVTGMMGATTILDEVDGDEAFGEGSETMGD